MIGIPVVRYLILGMPFIIPLFVYLSLESFLKLVYNGTSCIFYYKLTYQFKNVKEGNMNFKTSGEERQNFSLRKLAVGLVSVAVACFFLMGTGLQTVSAQESHTVNYTYVLESDLTDEEKALLVTSLPQVAEESDATYYLVYRANQVLPNTGTSSSLGTVALVAGLSLLIVVVLKGHDGKSKISRFLLVSALGSQLLSPTALALTSETLAAYNTQLSVQVGDALPAPVDIPGYTYIGYVKNKVDVVKQSDKQKAHDSKSNLENVDRSVVEPQQQESNETVVQAKGTQEPGHEGDALVQPVQPTYTEPVSTQGTQESGHEGEALVRPVQPTYTEPVSTQGTQESGHEGEALVQPVQPAYTAPISTQGTQESGHEGEALVQPVQPAYTDPISTQGTQESGHEGESLVQSELPVYTGPQEGAPVEPTVPESTEVVSSKGTQEPGHEGEALVQPVQPSYTAPISTQGTQEPGHEGEALVQPVQPAYTAPVEAKGTQESGHEGESLVQPELPSYTGPISTQGTQESGHEGEAAVAEALPELPLTSNHRTVTETIPHETEEIEDATILKNHREIAQEGKDGLRTIEYEDYLVDGKVEASKEISRTEVAPTKEIVKVGSLVKTKPTVEITNLVKDESKKAVAVNYRLDDPTSAFVKAKAQIFQNGTLIKEVDLKDLSVQQTIDGLDYYTPYTIKTYLTYNLGQSDQENTEVSTKDFQLDYKKIEIKDVDEVGLYGKEDGHYRRYLNLSEVPSDLSPYFVKVKSDKMKEMLLPVSSIKETDAGKYKVTVAFNELVQEEGSTYKDNYSFTIDKQKLAKDGIYTSFKKLIAAMQGDLAGTFKLGADMTADEVSLAKGQTSYVTGTFTGNLIGASDGKPFAIYDLKTALFDSLTKATVKDIDLKAVAIKSQEDTASLAKVATNSQISNVAVEGQLTGSKSVAGLVAKAQDTEITNSSFTGSIQAKHVDASPYYVGGIAGLLSGNKAKIDKVAVDANISSNARNNDQFAGGIVGKVQSGALVSHALASGTILNTTTYPRVGGIAGSTWQNGRIHHVVSMVNAGDGYAITGDQYRGADIKDASTAVENKKADLYATSIT